MRIGQLADTTGGQPAERVTTMGPRPLLSPAPTSVTR